jgi:autotransporter strand-loop-strand O-heptosyltransferase
LSSQTDKINPITVDLKPGEYFTSPYQYFIDWNIKVWGEDNNLNQLIPGAKVPLWEYNLDLTNQVVFIKMDAYALGDNLAWLPYVDSFQQKHKCRIICSTFHNHLFVDVYPNIMFVQPNTRIDNVYAQYYIGTHDHTPPIYSPTTYITEPLQKIASDILGLDFEDLKCKVAHIPQPKNPKKICLSEFASLDMKTWHGDWQEVVDTLVKAGYEIHVISREKTALKNVVDKSGDIPIEHRVADLASASYFIGVSSGLSWLAHSLDCHVFLISDFTPKNHEFNTNVTRIYGSNVRTQIEYKPVEKEVSTDRVLRSIKQKLAIL